MRKAKAGGGGGASLGYHRSAPVPGRSKLRLARHVGEAGDPTACERCCARGRAHSGPSKLRRWWDRQAAHGGEVAGAGAKARAAAVGAVPVHERFAAVLAIADQRQPGAMLVGVLGPAVKAEILRAVVGPDAVDVMDDLGGLQRPAQDTLHHQAVQEEAPSGEPEPGVALVGDGAPTLRAAAATRRRWGWTVAELRFGYRAESGGDGWPTRP